MRQWVNNNPIAVATGATAALVLALGVILWQYANGGPRPVQAYYYDQAADEFFVASADALPPISTPAGHDNGLRASVYACGQCPPDIAGKSVAELGQTSAFLGYLERYADDARHVLETTAPTATDPEQAERRLRALDQILIRSPDSDQWHHHESEQAIAIIDTVDRRCQGTGGTLRTCRP